MINIDLEKLSEIVSVANLITDSKLLSKRYCDPNARFHPEIPLLAVFPTNSDQISRLIKYFRTINEISVLIVSSKTTPKFLEDTIPTKNTAILDLTKMTNIPFINKRNKVCVVEAGVTWEDLIEQLKGFGLRPRAPFLPRKGKSALASVLERAPHLCPKAQFDISDPLLCMEVVFGTGDIFRTGEAAGPQSIEENRQYGGALKNPLGPGQTDIFRLIQGSQGTYGCVSWISMQCDFIPTNRIIKLIDCETINPLIEFIYTVIRRRLVDELFIINKNLFNSIFPKANDDSKQFILIYAINGYEWLPLEKIQYQTEDCADILDKMGLSATDSLAGVTQKDIEPILDGYSTDPHPKYSEKTIAVDIFYVTTLDRIPHHLNEVQNLLKKYQFPLTRLNLYIQPVIQARAAHIEFSLIADNPSLGSTGKTSFDSTQNIVKEIAQFAISNGGFFSRPYKLVNKFAFAGHKVYMDGLRRIKQIFDPDEILNKGGLCF